MLKNIITQFRQHRVTATIAAAISLVAAWVGQTLAELLQHAIYGWILERMQPLFAYQEAALIASILAYLPGIITAVIVFIGVFWIGTRAFKHADTIDDYPTISPSLADPATRSESVIYPVVDKTRDGQISCSIDGWEKLYEEYDTTLGRKELRLRFLPDTADQIRDALVLICYGYKMVMGIDRVDSAFVDSQIDDLFIHAPNSLERRSPFFNIAAVMVTVAKLDHGKTAVPRYVERVGLSKGGRYKITPYGEEHARQLADDLIRRA